jgi:type II secretory pathway pseudopilin PulG
MSRAGDPLNGAPGAGRSESGITLIELSIFLVLMAILYSFAVPRIAMVTEMNLRTSARQIAETLLELSAQATARAAPYAVVYDLDKRRYCYKQASFDTATGKWTVLFTDEETEEVGGDPQLKQRCFDLEEGVYFKDIEPLLRTEKTIEKGRVDQWFSPRGITDPLVIHLGDQKGRFYTLFLGRYGGKVDVRQGLLEYKEYLQEMLE